MKTLGTYRFKDKDPVIDVVRTCLQIYAALRNIKFRAAMKEVSAAAGVSVSAMDGWFDGDTVSPRFCSAAAVVRATGEGIKIGRHVVGGAHRYRVVQGGKKAA